MNVERYYRSLEEEKTTSDALTLAFKESLAKNSHCFIIETSVRKSQQNIPKDSNPKISQICILHTSQNSHIGPSKRVTTTHKEVLESTTSCSFAITEEEAKIEELQDENERLEKEEEKQKQEIRGKDE